MSDGRASFSLEAIGRSALILTGGTAAVQVIGVLRELYVAARVGVSGEFDALLIALVLPTTLAAALTSGATTALVPAYLEARSQAGAQEARHLAGSVLAWIGIAGLVLWAGLVLFANGAVAVGGPGLSAASRDSAIGYLPLVAPIAFVSAVSAILYSVCQAEEKFVAMSVATLAGSGTTLVTMLLLWEALGLRALAVGSLVGPMVMLAILIGTTVSGSILPTPHLGRNPRLGTLLRHAGPLTLSAAILQINTIGDRAIASLLGTGAVSALRYADVLVRIPIGAIGPAWGAAVYPARVHSAVGTVGSTLGDAASRLLHYAIAVFIPLAILTAAVAPVAVGVAYGRGAFTPADVSLTAQVVVGMAPLLVVFMTSAVLTGSLNARRRGQVLLAGGIINVVLNISLDVVLGLSLGVIGIALSSSITQTIVLVFFVRRLAASEPGFEIAPLTRSLVLACVASVPVSFVAAVLSWSGLLPHETILALISLGVLALAGLGGYLAMARWIGLAEPMILARASLGRVAGIRRMFGR